MAPAGYKAFLIVSAGLMLGAAGGMMVKPVPKEPEPQPWQLTGRPEFTAPADSYQWIEAGPQEVAISPRDSYPPSWASDPAIWQYPEPRFAEWEPEPYPNLAEMDSPSLAAREADAAEEIAAVAEAVATEATQAAPAPELGGEPEPKQPAAEDSAPAQLAAIY